MRTPCARCVSVDIGREWEATAPTRNCPMYCRPVTAGDGWLARLLVLSRYRNDGTRCPPIQTGRIVWKECVRDIVHRRGSYRISTTYPSPSLETRDRVNQAIPMNLNLNRVHKHRKLVKHTILMTDTPDRRLSVGRLSCASSFVTGSANRSLMSTPHRLSKKGQCDFPNVVRIVRSLPRRNFPTL